MAKYLSVSEFARLHGKDPGNIRRLLYAGRLAGEKVGNQWIIPANESYPSDKRISTGKYRNWRKRVAFNKNKNLVKTISKMVTDVKLILRAS